MNYKNIIIQALLLIAFVVQLKAQNKISIELNTMQQEPGDKIDFPIQFSIPAIGLIAYEFSVNYDPSVLKPLSFEKASSWSVFINPVEPGKIKVGAYWANAAFNPDGQTSNFIPVSFEFEVTGLPGQVALVHLLVEGLYDKFENAIDYQLINGQVAINCNDDMLIGNADTYTKLAQGIFRANNNLSSGALVDAISDSVFFKAGQAIFLEPNFEVTKSSTFLATINECADIEMFNQTRNDTCGLNSLKN